MTHIATKTVLYHVKPGVVFALVEGEEVDATGFNLEQLLSSGLVKKANLLDKVKGKLLTKETPEEAEAAELRMIAREEEAEAESKEEEAEAPKNVAAQKKLKHK